jgi:hypothetical protein
LKKSNLILDAQAIPGNNCEEIKYVRENRKELTKGEVGNSVKSILARKSLKWQEGGAGGSR